jgi:hypothetical protein
LVFQPAVQDKQVLLYRMGELDPQTLGRIEALIRQFTC